jgi:hypothetical protein
LQFGVLDLCLAHDGNIWIGVFPESEEILVCGAGFRLGILCRCALKSSAITNEGQIAVGSGARAASLFNDRDQCQPFPVSKKDDLRIDIAKSGDDVRVIFTLITWGGTMGFTASCNGGLMYGYAKGAAYAVSFQKSPPI